MIPVEPPVDISREQAAEEAAKELSKSAYGQAGDSLISKIVNEILEWIADLLNNVSGTSPSGRGGVVMLLGLLALVVVVVLWRAGVLRRTRKASKAVFDTDKPLAAAQYRAQAEAEVAKGDYASAVRSRFRACVAELTERTILDERAGRTAYEVVADAERVAPTLQGPLRPAAQVFAEVVYGNRPGTPERYQVVLAADQAARRAKVTVPA